MKKIIIFLVTIFSMLNTYAQEECVEFDGAWIAAFGGATTIIKTDNYGYIYTSGHYTGSPTIGNVTLPSPPQPRTGAYIAKFDTLGNCLWVKHATGQGNIMTFNIEINQLSNHIYLSTSYTGSITFDGNNITASVPAASSESDGVLVLIDSSGQIQWIKTFPGLGSQDNLQHKMIKVSQNNIYRASGFTRDTVYINSDTFYNRGEKDIIISKLDLQGNVLFSKQIFSKQSESIADLALDENDNLYIIGTYEDTLQLGTLQLLPSFVGKAHLFVSKMDSNGVFEWANRSELQNINSNVNYLSINLNKSGKTWITGGFLGTVTLGNFTINYPQQGTYISNSFIAEINSQGLFQKVTHISGNDVRIANIFVDNFDNLYISGNYLDTIYINDTPIISNNWNTFFAKVQVENENSIFKSFLYSDGTASEYTYQMANSNFNSFYLTGVYNDGDAIFENNLLANPQIGGNGFIAKISDCELSNISTPHPLSLISIYPNPAQAQLNITNLPANSKVSISDIMGKVIYQQETMHRTIHIPTQHWSSGMYFVKIKSGKAEVNKKVVVSR